MTDAAEDRIKTDSGYAESMPHQRRVWTVISEALWRRRRMSLLFQINSEHFSFSCSDSDPRPSGRRRKWRRVRRRLRLTPTRPRDVQKTSVSGQSRRTNEGVLMAAENETPLVIHGSAGLASPLYGMRTHNTAERNFSELQTDTKTGK